MPINHTYIIILIFILSIIFINRTSIKEHFSQKDKIAFIFLTVGDVKQNKIWQHFFKNHKDKYNIYIHPKFPNKVNSIFKDHIIDKLIPTKWGDVSLVDATNILIENALKDSSNKKIILVSDSCIPIKNFDYIYNTVLKDKKSWFNYYRPDLSQGSKEHLRRINLLDKNVRDNAYINEQWMVLDRKHAELLNKNIHLMKYFRKPNLIPDEIYFITALHNIDPTITNELKFKKTNRKDYLKHSSVTYAKWYDPYIKRWQTKHPFEFNKMNDYDVINLKNSKALFARKFSPDSNIIKYWKYIVSNK